MEQRYLIDTNTISHLFSNRIPSSGKKFVEDIINSNLIISVVVEIEVLTYHEIPEKMALIEEFIKLADIIQLDRAITLKTIEIRKLSKRMKIADAIIAATALIHGLILITNNTKDFLHIENLVLIDPHSYNL
jgi:predicted nucleic acid-binding protein